MDDARARELLARERARIEKALVEAEAPYEDRDEPRDASEDANELFDEELGEGVAERLRQGLDWSTEAQAAERDSGRVWDTVQDMAGIGSFVDVYMKLWYCRKPTVAAVQGWCIGGGTDMVLCADLILAAESASFGYPPARVWGTPTTAMWVYRLGFQQAKRWLFTGDEIRAREAERIGLALEVVCDADLEERATDLARRIARVPANQLIMLKALCNQPAEAMGLRSE